MIPLATSVLCKLLSINSNVYEIYIFYIYILDFVYKINTTKTYEFL
jgi:hypothetical protein